MPNSPRDQPNLEHGYLALLDVLGFSALVAGDHDGARIKAYVDSLTSSISNRGVEAVIFSDSVILTTNEQGANGLALISQTCSELFYRLLDQGIAMRGAIVYGSFHRSKTDQGVFVAGNAVVDAYQREKDQDWVGIMVSPSAQMQVENFRQKCRRPAWPLPSANHDACFVIYIQPCDTIPFHPDGVYDGFGIVPTRGNINPADICEALISTIEKLQLLRSLAPNPRAQSKHKAAIVWLEQLRDSWRDFNVNMSLKARG